MKRYETVVIVPADLPDDEIAVMIDRYKSIITNQKGLVIKIERWGKRKLAYEIKKYNRGFYMLIDFAGQSAVVAELERNLKIDDTILKFMTVKKSDKVNAEELEREMIASSAPAPASETTSKIIETPAPSPAEETKPTEAISEGGA